MDEVKYGSVDPWLSADQWLSIDKWYWLRYQGVMTKEPTMASSIASRISNRFCASVRRSYFINVIIFIEGGGAYGDPLLLPDRTNDRYLNVRDQLLTQSGSKLRQLRLWSVMLDGKPYGSHQCRKGWRLCHINVSKEFVRKKGGDGGRERKKIPTCQTNAHDSNERARIRVCPFGCSPTVALSIPLP